MNYKRRDFLRMLGAGAAAGALLPMLESTGEANTTGFPTRLVVFFSANGTIPNRWRPQGTERDWSIRDQDILGPIKSYKDKLLILDGVDMVSAKNGPGDGHQTGMGHMLTGTELLPGDTKGGCDSCPAAGYSSGPSVDQYIAQQIYSNEAFQSLEFGVQCGGPNNWSRMCYSGRDQPVDPQQNPHNAFDRLFSQLGADKEKLARVKRRRRSVIDFVNADFKAIESRVSANDRQRIDQHLTSMRGLERRLMSGGEGGLACELPARGEMFDPNLNANYGQTGQAMMDMIVSALACGQTRVASLQWSRSVSNVKFPWLDVNEGHHDLSHRSDDDTPAVDALVKINRWYSEQFAYLLAKLDAVPEGEGTLLDNTIVLWCNELGKGNSHTRNDIPFILAGGGAGFFKMGHYFHTGIQSHNNLLVSICQAMGVDTQTFGNPIYCTGALTTIHA